jgi:hypothetical protein
MPLVYLADLGQSSAMPEDYLLRLIEQATLIEEAIRAKQVAGGNGAAITEIEETCLRVTACPST